MSADVINVVIVQQHRNSRMYRDVLMGDFRQLLYISLDFLIVHSKWKLSLSLFLFSLTSSFFFFSGCML
jgi:hypothetical protein